MYFISFFTLFLFFVCGQPASMPQTQNEASRYIRNVTAKFDGLKDYSADVRVHMDIENLKAPDMTARVYYKDPDKVKVDSKGLFFMPKEVGVFNPKRFNGDNFEMNVRDTLTYEGHPAVRIELLPKKSNMVGQIMILTIDKKEWLIREFSSAPVPGREVTAKIQYGVFGGFHLPTEIDVTFNFENADSLQAMPNSGGRFRGGAKGKVGIYYTDYNVNSGLSDSIFLDNQKSH